MRISGIQNSGTQPYIGNYRDGKRSGYKIKKRLFRYKCVSCGLVRMSVDYKRVRCVKCSDETRPGKGQMVLI